MKIAFLLAFSLVFAFESEDMAERKTNYFLSKKSQLLAGEQLPKETNPVHGPIADSLYVVGPGDVFTFSMWGRVTEDEKEITVNPEGNLIVPGIGIVKTNCSLRDVKQKVQALVKGKTKSVELIFELKNVRSSLVSVTGEVPHPGSMICNSTVRLSDAMINAFNDALNNPNLREKASLRNVQIVSGGHPPVSFDFEDYLRNGNMENNPYLPSGSQVIVPSRSASVSVTGSVIRPGLYDFRDETVYDLIRFAGGFSPGADSALVTVIGYQPDGVTLEMQRRAYPEECKSRVMRPDDRVVVGTRPDWHDQVSVNVIGRVRNPGCYTLQKESGLKELFQAAGGMLPDADSTVCYLNRPNFYGRPINPNLKDRLAENQVFNPAIISLDFGASGKKAAGVRLEDGDTVFVPRKTGDVSVVGRVALPGLYPYRPGKSWAYYIDQAGGFDQNAYTSKSKIYKKDMEAWVFAKRGLAVDAGDVIVVPERPHDYYWNKIKDAITITSGIISIMATYLVLTR